MMMMLFLSMCLLGNQVVELFLGNNAISVSVTALDHLLQDGIVGEFSEIFGNFSEVLECDEALVTAAVPVFWTSKVMKTLWTSSRVSLSEGLVVIM